VKINSSIVLSIVFQTLFIVGSIGCDAQATEYHEDELEQHDDDDKIVFEAGSNVPATSFLFQQSSVAQSLQEVSFTCVLNAPYEVQRYAIACDSAKYVDVTVADCCISGDIWKATVKSWDQKPNTSSTISPDLANEKSNPARVYNYGGTENAPDKLTALLECSYNHGVNVFPAGALFKIKSDGYCTVKNLGNKINL